MRTVFVLLSCLLTQVLTAGIAGPSDGVGFAPVTLISEPTVTVPAGFDADQATQEMLAAKEYGDIERANELSLQINQFWKQNRVEEFDPSTTDLTGTVTRQRPESGDETGEPSSYAPFWGTDIRIDSRDNCYGGNIVSLSNGDLYSIFVYYSSPNYYRVTRRSTNGGTSWSTCNEVSFSIAIYHPRLSVADDTLIMYYYMRDGSGNYQAWVKTVLPGAALTDITYGSPSGGYITDYIKDFVVTNDGPNYNSKWIFATWTQGHTTGTDQTYVRFARSSDMDVSTWEIQDTITNSNGDGIYFYETGLEVGQLDNLVLVTSLHPSGWPQSFDEYIRGYTSSNGGSDWSSVIYITDMHNHMDENQPTIAGSHYNHTWFCIARVSDTTYTTQHLYNYYSTDNGATWIEDAWVTAYDNCFKPFVYIDYLSSDVFAVFRIDQASSEELRYKEGHISAPTSWSTSVVINDDLTNLSWDYGPRVCYDYARSNACVMWTDYHSSVYSVWFDRTAVTGVEEEPVIGDLGTETFAVSQIGRNFRITYSVASAGNVSIDVFDVTGRNVAKVFDGVREPGTYTLDFSPEFAQGSYFFTMSTPEGTKTRRAFLAQ
ncbi:hypothetical protein JXL83_05320 [candidate division WOR-3 bacterium]|nr:hypothetical protein [candidate division WOR-3 bacterium]